MLRILKAFAWLRWRMLVNSLEKTGSRDALERFSLAIERIGPLLAAILLIPSALFLVSLGVAAGYLLATGGSSMPFAAARYLLIPIPVLAVVGPLFLPAADRTNPVRLLLLPIPRSTLYLTQTSSAFGDLWNILFMPLIIGVPIGLAAGGAAVAALWCLATGVVLVLMVVGLSALATSLLHLVVRDRRRGELVALIFILIIPAVAMLPGILGSDRARRGAERRQPILPTWVAAAGAQAFSYYPTEVYVRGTQAAADGRDFDAAAAFAAIAGSAIAAHALGIVAFARVLGSPGSTGGKRTGRMHAAWGTRLPFLSSGASAVALAQMRLALRTPRGRSILLSPIAMLVIFGAMMYRGSGQMDFGPFRFGNGLGLAAFGSFVCLLSILPIAMNQFAVDKAGLTMTLLSPLSDAEVLSGKAAGNAMIAAPPALVAVLAPLLVFPGGQAGLWVGLLLGLMAMYLVVAPVAAICSAAFPRSVDMNSIGRGSNAHGAAGFLGLLAFVAAAAPPAVLALVATSYLGRPELVPLLIGGWLLVAWAISRLLFIPARRVFAARRENLAMLD